MLTDVRLQNFRSYKDSSFELGAGVNIIVGPNASGKTNLLEAIMLIATGKSYRSSDANLVKSTKPWARLDAHTLVGQRTIKLVTTTENKLTKSFEIDSKPFKRLTLSNSLPIVLFEPNILWLFSSKPSLRRDYIDDILEQTAPGFSEIRRKYSRALRQRNTLLKQGITVREQLFAWDLRLSELGGQIVSERLKLVEQIDNKLPKIYSQLAGKKTKLTTNYKTPLKISTYPTQMLKALETNIEKDALRGYTSVGPHRDDLEVSIGPHLATMAASRGEIRTLVLALKTVELSLVEQARGQKPILLLDDVFSELDGRRRHALTEFLSKYQTFITTTDADIIVKEFSQKSTVLTL